MFSMGDMVFFKLIQTTPQVTLIDFKQKAP